MESRDRLAGALLYALISRKDVMLFVINESSQLFEYFNA